jgi:MerR family regulatory protein
MSSALAIGGFSRATHLSVKTLRYYHQIGLLAPADVAPETGYRRYATGRTAAHEARHRQRDSMVAQKAAQRIWRRAPASE